MPLTRSAAAAAAAKAKRKPAAAATKKGKGARTRAGNKRAAAAAAKPAAAKPTTGTATTASKQPAAAKPAAKPAAAPAAAAKRKKQQTKPPRATPPPRATAATTRPTLASLPEVVHDAIAEHLGQREFAALARLDNQALRSLALPRLARLAVQAETHDGVRSTSALLRLLRQTPRATALRVTGLDALPALVRACEEGLCARVQSLELEFRDARTRRWGSDGGGGYDVGGEIVYQPVSDAQLQGWLDLVARMGSADCFPALMALQLRHEYDNPHFRDPAFTMILLQALAKGASKHLRRLDFGFATTTPRWRGCVRHKRLARALARMLDRRRALGCANMAELPMDWLRMVDDEEEEEADLGPRVYKAVLAGAFCVVVPSNARIDHTFDISKFQMQQPRAT